MNKNVITEGNVMIRASIHVGNVRIKVGPLDTRIRLNRSWFASDPSSLLDRLLATLAPVFVDGIFGTGFFFGGILTQEGT